MSYYDDFFNTLPSRSNKGKSLIDLPDDYVVFDITTGDTSYGSDLFEIAAHKVVNDVIVSSFHELIKHDNNIYVDDFVVEKTGITHEMLLTQGIDLEIVLKDFLDFIGSSVLITHYNGFVINYVYDILEHFGHIFNNDFVDTMRIAKKVYPNLVSYSQDYLLDFLVMPPRKHKRSLTDIDNIFDIYKHLKSKVYNEKIVLSYRQLNPYKVNISEDEKIDNPMIKNKHFAFTGTLEKMERKDACELVVRNSGICDSSIIKKTNYLVLGELDYAKTKHGEKSSKILKAEKLISDGIDLKIIDENYFYEMIRSVNDE